MAMHCHKDELWHYITTDENYCQFIFMKFVNKTTISGAGSLLYFFETLSQLRIGEESLIIGEAGEGA